MKIKYVIVSSFPPSVCHKVMGPDGMIFIWMLSFKPAFSLSYFTLIERLFNSSSLSAVRVVSSTYLRLLMFVLAVLIPACASSSPAFRMMYSAYKLNNQGDDIQHWCTPYLIWNQSVVPCPVLTVASWPAHRFLKKQLRWSGIPISWRIFQFVLIYTVKGFSIVNEADFIFWYSLAFSMIQRMLAIWYLVPLPFLNPACTSGSSQFMYWWSLAWIYLASMWNECNFMVVWTFFAIGLLWNWNEDWPFPVLWPLLSFPNLLAEWVQHFHGIIF